MKVFMKMFETQLEKHMNLTQTIECKTPPEKLLRELKSNQGKKLIKILQTPTNNPFKIIRMFSVCHLLLIYSKNWFEVIEQNLKYLISKDEWLNNKFLEPYYRLIIKCCASKETYNQMKNATIKKGECFQMLFYSINMLKQLFKVVQKMPLIGRYYKPKRNQVISTAIQIIALQAQKIYNTFKNHLSQILYDHETYIKNREDQTIFRGILVDQLTYINQELKKLFLDKYFYPLGRGITIKLFRPEEQSPECEKTINAIISNHEQTERQKRHEQLEHTLFPGSGVVNWNFYEETLMSGPMLNVSKPQNTTFVQLNDLVISQQDEVVEQIPNPKTRVKKEQSQRQTNTGTLQIKGHEL